MATVKFNHPDEFIDELQKEFGGLKAGLIPTIPPILRLTNLFRTIPEIAPIMSLTVVATIRVRDDIIKLERYCGQIWKMESQDKPTQERAEEVHRKLEEAAKELGLEVRAGVFEE